MTVEVRLQLELDGQGGVVNGLRVVKSEVGDVGEATDRTARDTDDLTRAQARNERQSEASVRSYRRLGRTVGSVVGVALAAGAAFTAIADQQTLLQSRIGLVTDTVAEYNTAQRETFEIAQETGTTLDSTILLYTRLQEAVRDLGESQETALQITRTINQSFLISGSSAQEAAGAIRQFAQGLSAGTLRGDEFNSVVEQAPRLARALADELGVTRGELRGLAEDGELTASTIISALKNAADEIQADFDELPLTVGRASTQLANEIKASIALINTELQITETIANAIADVADAIRASREAGQAIEQAASQADSAVVSWAALGAAMSGIPGVDNSPTSWTDWSTETGDALAEVAAAAQENADAAQEAAEAQNSLQNQIDSAIAAQLAAALADSSKRTEEFVEATEEATEKLVEQREELELGQVGLLLLNAEREKATRLTQEEKDEIDRVTAAQIAEIEAINELTQAKKDAAEAQRQKARADREAERLAKAQARETERLVESLEDLEEQAGLVTREERQLREAQEILNDAFERGLITAFQYAAVIAGIKDNLEDACETAKETTECVSELEEALQRVDDITIDNLGRAFGDFFADLELDFDRLFDDLVRIAQQRSSDLLQAGFGDLLRNGLSAQNIGTILQGGAPGIVGGLFGNESAAIGAQLGGLVGGAVGGNIFASLGSFAGPLGTVIGSVLGGVLGDLFDDSNPPRVAVVNNLNQAFVPNGINANSPFTDQFGNPIRVALQEITEEFGFEAGRALLDGIIAFDQAIFSILDDAQRRAVGQILVPGGNTETRALFSGDFTPEEILADRFETILGAFSQDIQDLVNTVGGDLDNSVQALQDALAIENAIGAGQGILGTLGLSEAFDVIEDLNIAGERLAETYARIEGSTAAYNQVLDLLGQTYDGTTRQLIDFALSITDAAGGLPRASQLWGAFFSDTFFEPEELINAQLSAARSNAARELADIGLDADTTALEFRTLFEEALPELSAEAVVEWLQAAEALGVVVDLEEELNNIRGEGAESTEEALQRERELVDLRREVGDILAEASLSDFNLALRSLNQTFDELRDRAIALGAEQQVLVDIERARELQLQALIAELESDIGDQVAQLFGTPLDEINAQIDAITQSQLSGNRRVLTATQNRFSAELAAAQRLDDFIQGLLVDDRLSSLSPADQLEAARANFEETLALAQGGDIDAFNRLSGVADTFLTEARDFFASSAPYDEIFNSVLAGLQSVDVPSIATTGGGRGGVTTVAVSPELAALFAERDAILAEEAARERSALALELAANLGDLADAVGKPLTEVADQVGVSLTDLIGALGISLDEVTEGTVTELAALANVLGVELVELADGVDLALGNLADSQSLLNDGLEAVIDGLPEGIQDELEPLLRAVESATSEADANDAIAALELAVNELAPEFRDQLAPFFDGVDVGDSPEVEALDGLRQIITDQQIPILRQIRDALVPLPEANPLNVASSFVGDTPQRLLADVNAQLRVINTTLQQGNTDRNAGNAQVQRQMEQANNATRELAAINERVGSRR